MSFPALSPLWTTVVMLIGSNLFMTVAWYGHLKYRTAPLIMIIAISWMIALPEYILQVPANRWGHSVMTAPQLKGLQEVISISVFALFSIFYLRETPNMYQWLGYGLLIIAAMLILKK
jgi:uncharacterized protein